MMLGAFERPETGMNFKQTHTQPAVIDATVSQLELAPGLLWV
jgi:hypothetical protein